MSQIELLEPHKLPTKEEEYDRAKSDYLNTSRNPHLYWQGIWGDDYWVAEERAWNRLVSAAKELGLINE